MPGLVFNEQSSAGVVINHQAMDASLASIYLSKLRCHLPGLLLPEVVVTTSALRLL